MFGSSSIIGSGDIDRPLIRDLVAGADIAFGLRPTKSDNLTPRSFIIKELDTLTEQDIHADLDPFEVLNQIRNFCSGRDGYLAAIYNHVDDSVFFSQASTDRMNKIYDAGTDSIPTLSGKTLLPCFEGNVSTLSNMDPVAELGDTGGGQFIAAEKFNPDENPVFWNPYGSYSRNEVLYIKFAVHALFNVNNGLNDPAGIIGSVGSYTCGGKRGEPIPEFSKVQMSIIVDQFPNLPDDITAICNSIDLEEISEWNYNRTKCQIFGLDSNLGPFRVAEGLRFNRPLNDDEVHLIQKTQRAIYKLL